MFARRFWTPLSMYQDIGRELGIAPRPHIAPMLDAIVTILAQSGRTVIIDEANYLLDDARLADGQRDFHDLSGAPLVLVGMGDFRRAALAKPQLTGRVGADVEFGSIVIEDARLTADTLCEVEVQEAATAMMHDGCAGEIRRLVGMLARAETWALRNGREKITGMDWMKIAPEPPRPARARRVCDGAAARQPYYGADEIRRAFPDVARDADAQAVHHRGPGRDVRGEPRERDALYLGPCACGLPASSGAEAKRLEGRRCRLSARARRRPMSATPSQGRHDFRFERFQAGNARREEELTDGDRNDRADTTR